MSNLPFLIAFDYMGAPVLADAPEGGAQQQAEEEGEAEPHCVVLRGQCRR